MKARTTERKHGRRTVRPETRGGAGASGDILPLPEVRVLCGASIEQLVEAVKQAAAEGFERDGEAFFDGDQKQPFRQTMVRYPPETVRRGNVSVRKRRR